MVTPIKSTLRITAKFTSSPLSPNLLSPLKQINNFKRKCCTNQTLSPKKLIFNEHKFNIVSNVKAVHNNNNNNNNNSDNKKQPNLDDCLDLVKSQQKPNNNNKWSNIIGRGTFGVVIKGIYKDKQVAIKIVQLDRKRYLNEFNSLELDHANIIRTFDIIPINNHNLIIMEYIDNVVDLHSILINRNFQNNKKIKYAIDIIKGLDYCHKMNILHLDLKPKNILLCDDVCKICDFGNSILTTKAPYFNALEFHGTVAYTAPELLTGQKPTTKCDIYSFGILLWQLETQQYPYENLDNEIVIYHVVKYNLRPDDHQSNQVSDFVKLYRNCWKKSPNDRPEITAILKQLKTINLIDS